MVDATGHAAFGLLFATPAWFVWHGRSSALFAGFAAAAALLPDVDVWLSQLFPSEVHHHGVTHTVVFVVLASIVGGALVAGLFARRIDGWTDDERFDRRRLFAFATAAFLLGGLSHLVGDILSAPDISTPIEPLWPFLNAPVGLDLVWFNAWWINAGFLAVMVALHLVLAYVTVSEDRRGQLWTTR